jgi:hypothetical protein
LIDWNSATKERSRYLLLSFFVQIVILATNRGWSQFSYYDKYGKPNFIPRWVTADEPHSHRVVVHHQETTQRGRRWSHLDTTASVSIMQDDIYQRSVNPDAVIEFVEADPVKSIHEKACVRASRANPLCQAILRDPWNQRRSLYVPSHFVMPRPLRNKSFR